MSEQLAPKKSIAERLTAAIASYSQYIESSSELALDGTGEVIVDAGDPVIRSSNYATIVFNGEKDDTSAAIQSPYEFVNASLIRLSDGRVTMQLEAFSRSSNEGVNTPENTESKVFTLHTSPDDEGLVVTELLDEDTIEGRIQKNNETIIAIRAKIVDLKNNQQDTKYQEEDIVRLQEEAGRLRIYGIGDTLALNEQQAEALLTDIENGEVADNGVETSALTLGKGLIAIWDNPPSGNELVNGAPDERVL